MTGIKPKMTALQVIPLLVAIVTLATAVMSLYASTQNGNAIKEVKVSIDGRLEQFLKLTAKSSHAEGVIEGEKNSGGKAP